MVDILEFAAKRDIPSLRHCMEHGIDINTPHPQFGWTALHIAAVCGDVEIVDFLLLNKADIHARNIFGWSPLHCACYGNHSRVAEILAQQGCDVNAMITDGSTPLDHACQNRNPQLVEVLLNAGAVATDTSGIRPLFLACEQGDTPIVELLLNAGASVHSRNLNHATPLHEACQRDHMDIAELLLRAGADPHATNTWGERPSYIDELLAKMQRGTRWSTHTHRLCSNVFPGSHNTIATLLMLHQTRPMTAIASLPYELLPTLFDWVCCSLVHHEEQDVQQPTYMPFANPQDFLAMMADLPQSQFPFQAQLPDHRRSTFKRYRSDDEGGAQSDEDDQGKRHKR